MRESNPHSLATITGFEPDKHAYAIFRERPVREFYRERPSPHLTMELLGSRTSVERFAAALLSVCSVAKLPPPSSYREVRTGRYLTLARRGQGCERGH